MSDLLGRLRGGLIVSVQAWKGSALDDPHVIAAMARAAKDGGAVAVRVQGVECLRAVRARIDLPIVGLIKREYAGFAPYITPTLEEVAAIVAAAQARGVFREEVTPEFAAQAFYGCIEQVLTGWIFEDGPVSQADLEHAKTLIVTTICTGLEIPRH